MPRIGGSSSYLGVPNSLLTKTAAYTAVPGDWIMANAVGGPFTITLPSNPAIGVCVNVQKTDATANVVTVDPTGAGTIHGDPEATLESQWTGITLEHQGSNVWAVIAFSPASMLQGDTGWITPTLLNSWVNLGGVYTTAAYRKINGIVYCKGTVTTGAQGTVIFNLPAGFRPLQQKIVAPFSSAVYVKANGDIEANVKGTTYISLDDITPFPAES